MKKRVWALVLTFLLIGAGASVGFARKPQPGRKARVSSKRSSRTRAASSKRTKRGRARIAASKRWRGKRVASRRRNRRRHRRWTAEEVVASGAARPQPGIPPERVTEIQNALIRLGYLDPPSSGQYDDKTIEAIKEFQHDHKLQTTGLPSAYTLKKLGVSKRSSDGFAVPVTTVSESDKKRPPQTP